MKCELCHEHDAETVLMRPAKTGGRAEELYVCHQCAEREETFDEHGIQVAAMNADELPPFGIGNAMPPGFPVEGEPISDEEKEQLLKEIEEAGLPPPQEIFGKLGEMFGELSEKLGEMPIDRLCPTCGMSLKTVREEGILGCPDCIKAFEPILSRLLEDVQQTKEYQGKPSERFAHVHELKRLQAALDAAIAREDYVEAKKLRAKIEWLRGGGSADA